MYKERSLALALGESAMALAGGQSLIPLLRLRIARPSRVVDIGRLPSLSGISVSDESAELGALVTTADVAVSDDIGRSNPLWAEAARVIADPLVRNLGTVGGNLAHADPLNDLPAALVASRGDVRAEGHNGVRRGRFRVPSPQSQASRRACDPQRRLPPRLISFRTSD